MTVVFWKRGRALLAALILFFCVMSSAFAAEYDSGHPELLEEGHLNCSAAILIEAKSGNVIFEKNADAVMYPASTTKVLTVWLALSLCKTDADLQTKITVSENATRLASDESSAKLAVGEQVALIDLMYASVLVSGNDAATAIAEGLSGSVANFAEYMNFAAKSLGCTHTHFVNANGLHDPNHYTTARDLAIITRVAMQNETFKKIVSSTSHTLPKDNIYRARELTTGVRFLVPTDSVYYEYGTGVKTGTTSAAGRCFIASAEKNGVELIAVVLGATNDTARYTDAKKLMEYGFSQYKSITLAELYAMNPRFVDVLSFALDDEEVGRLDLKLQATEETLDKPMIMTQKEIDLFVQSFFNNTVTDFSREFRAPITEGEVMGTLTYRPADGGADVVYNIIAGRSIKARPKMYKSLDDIVEEAKNDANPFPRLTFEIVLLYVLLPAAAVIAAVHGIRTVSRRIRSSMRPHRKKLKSNERYFN